MRLAGELRRRGHEAAIFTRAPAAANPEAPEIPVESVPGGPIAIAHGIAERVLAFGCTDAIIEYTAQMWGASRFGSAALPLLAARLEQAGVSVSLALHELYTDWSWRPDLLVGSALLRLQLCALIAACDRVFVTTQSRQALIAGPVAALAPPPAVAVMRIGPNALPVESRAPGGHRIGLFSTLALGKRFDVALAAFEEIAAAFPDAELHLIGDIGASPRRTALEQTIAASPAGRRVHLTGKLSLPEVAATVADLDLYFFIMDTGANTRSGTLPVALGAGVPVVAIRGAETDPLFVHGDNVFLADGLEGPAFARAARQLFADPALAAQIGEGGARLYREHLSWACIADSLLETLGPS